MLSIPELIKQTCQSVRRIEASTAFSEMRENNGLMIDVREPGEVAAQSADGTINIPRGVLEMKIADVCKDADAPIYLHCASGGRAALAAKQLQKLGYTNVTAISCSIDDICRTQN